MQRGGEGKGNKKKKKKICVHKYVHISIVFAFDCCEIGLQNTKGLADTFGKNSSSKNGIPFEYKTFVLIGNKCDLTNDRKVFRDSGKIFADENRWLYFECSALHDINVSDMFTTIIETVNKKLDSLAESTDQNKCKCVIQVCHYNFFPSHSDLFDNKSFFKEKKKR
ncbi:hypothetical protein RFI_23429 [Reticulomyxa filosa]|uniref:Uncharacterized protein n=1 Tax=Reticulomyxa filosa TaxID=46433 RepID=X6MKH3_RETFI|nr:hypothetical protein RFI_23429 [Reticulomyxa filosa]|eukprot:ETO13937.1 hypothetical protein RFI_23429 [Reticulomyxa filosa]